MCQKTKNKGKDNKEIVHNLVRSGEISDKWLLKG